MKLKPETDAERLVFMAHRYGQARVQAEHLQKALEEVRYSHQHCDCSGCTAADEALKHVMDWKNLAVMVEAEKR